MARGGGRTAAVEPVEDRWALPDGWRWERLGDLGAWSGGGTPSKARPEFWRNGTIPWVSPKDMKRFSIDSSEDQITPEALAGSSTKMVRAGAVLCVMRSGILRHTFPVAVTTVDVTLNQDMRAMTLPASVNADFLARYLQFSGRTVLENASKDGTTVNSIDAERLDRHAVPLPDLDVQQRIVARIDELFTEIDDGEAALARAREDLGTWRKALLKAAVTGELTADWRAANPPAETGAALLARILTDRRARWHAEPRNKGKKYVELTGPDAVGLPGLPTGWVWTNVQQLSTVIRGASPRPAGDPKYFGGTIPWITVGSLTRDESKFLTSVGLFVTEEGRRCSRYVEPETLLFTNSGATLGVPKITQIGGCINDGSVALLDLAEPLKSFVYYHLRTQTEKLRNLNQGAAQPNLNTTIVKEVAVPLPSLSEMAEIVTKLDQQGPSQLQLEEIGHAGDLAATLRQSILAAAFRGNLVR